jgi:hypothetical protein
LAQPTVFVGAAICPVGSGGLGIHVDDGGVAPVLERSHRQVESDGGFTYATFLHDDCSYNYIVRHVYTYKCRQLG